MIDTLCYEAMNFWVSIFVDLGETVFYIEKSIGDVLSTDVLENLYSLMLGFSMSLLVLKALKKGFWTYILWRDGDADAPVQQSVINLVLAIITAICFPTLYTWFADIGLWLIEKLSFFSVDDILDIQAWTGIINVILGSGIIAEIVVIIYIIMLFVLYLHFLKRSAELFILRIGFPLACLGLLDSDNGVFSTTVKALLQTAHTTICQLLFLLLSMSIFMSSGGVNLKLIFSIACCMAAFSTPKMLQHILLPVGGGGGLQKAEAQYILSHLLRGFCQNRRRGWYDGRKSNN